MRRLLATSCVLALAFAARAGDGDRAPPEDWRTDPALTDLAPSEVEHLAASRLLLTRREERQVFEFYLSAKRPFVTTDTVFAAYHVLLEASVGRLESARTARLATSLAALWAALPDAAAKAEGDPAANAAGLRRARLTVAVALRLLGRDAPGLADDDAALVAAEVAAIEKAEGRGTPAWLGPWDPQTFPCIDYDSCRPRGMYEYDAALGRLFRATRWLQSVVFREAVPAEAAGARILRTADRDARAGLGAFAGTYAGFVGAPRRRCVFGEHSTGIRSPRSVLDGEVEEDPPPEIDDDAQPGTGAEQPIVALILPPGDPPENALFRALLEPPDGRPPRIPDALDVGVALGSSYAAECSTATERPAPSALVARSRGPDSLATLWHRTAATLVDAPEPDAPAFLANPAWRAKGLASALAGWAQWRHAWVLQAEESASYLCATSAAPGVVEPEPEFFERLAELTATTRGMLDDAGAFGAAPGEMQARSDLRAFAAWLASPATNADRELRETAPFRGATWAAWLGRKDAVVWTVYASERTSKPTAEQTIALSSAVLALAEAPWSAPPKLLAEFASAGRRLASRWTVLESTCRTLATMAHRQLRGVPWTDDDREFFRGFGLRLARLHLYDGESWTDPRDDAHRAVSVSTQVDASGVQRSWHVGVGRPRQVVVLWPQAGRDVVFTGGVLPFHETTEDHRLTDAEWRARFPEDDTATRPAQPAWAEPLRPR